MSAFTEKDWETVLAHLADVIGADAQRYAKVPAAKLFAAIPYLAGSEDPDRFAVSNLLTFHGATKARKLFNHRSDDDADVYRRLAAFHVGSKADPKVVDYGLTLLALISLSDHEHDAEGDRKAGKYNPVNAGKWNTKAMRAELQAELDQNTTLKTTFSQVVDTKAAVQGFWNS